jgi:hypothetical protein
MGLTSPEKYYNISLVSLLALEYVLAMQRRFQFIKLPRIPDSPICPHIYVQRRG